MLNMSKESDKKLIRGCKACVKSIKNVYIKLTMNFTGAKMQSVERKIIKLKKQLFVLGGKKRGRIIA